jgi:hypothetical protein
MKYFMINDIENFTNILPRALRPDTVFVIVIVIGFTGLLKSVTTSNYCFTKLHAL